MTDLHEFNTFGEFLKYLRRRVRLSQRELSIAVGYSESQISRLETNLRPPDRSTLLALFAPALSIENEPNTLARLYELAALGRGEAGPTVWSPSAEQPSNPVPRPPPNNLPLQLTNFIGRDAEIATITKLLSGGQPDRPRMVTLTGAGGSGKTRLALQAAKQLLADFIDGVWLVDLTPVADPALVPQTIAVALGLREESSLSELAKLSGYLRGKSLLLVLDNCEHLVEACAQVAEQLLRSAPGLHLLATSQERLGVDGERLQLVPLLSLPEGDLSLQAQELAEFEGIRLFVDRAQAVRPDFALSDANAGAVAQICRALDGIPLAIELAAARVQALSVEQIAVRLDDRFRLLGGVRRAAPPRQQTLRATIDWSYGLLSSAQQGLLRCLSVFKGGWTLEAIEAVAVSQSEVVELLLLLVDKSLVLSERRPDQTIRFRVLGTIHQYAAEKLVAAGEAEAANSRHLAFYLALAEEAARQFRGRAQAVWLSRLTQETDNLRAALSWALKQEDAESALRLAGALREFWDISAQGQEGCRWLEAALNLTASRETLARSAWRAKALLGIGLSNSDIGPLDRISLLEESLSIYHELGDVAGTAAALNELALWRRLPGGYVATIQMLEQALNLWIASGDQVGIGRCLKNIAKLSGQAGNRAKALDFFRRSEAVLRATDDQWALLGILAQLAWQTWLDGDGSQACALLEEHLAALRQMGNVGDTWSTLDALYEISKAQGRYGRAREAALAMRNALGTSRSPAALNVRLGQIEYWQGGLDAASAHFEAALALFQELNDNNGLGWTPPWLGCVAYRAGDLGRARKLIEAGLALQDPYGVPTELAFSLFCLGDVCRAEGQPQAAARLYARSLNILVNEGLQPEVAAYLEAYAKLANATNQPLRAGRLLGAAAALRERMGTPVPPVERADHERAVTQARDLCDKTAFAAAWAEGVALDWQQAAALALETPPAE